MNAPQMMPITTTPRFGVGRVIALVVASLMALIGSLLAAGGGVLVWAHATQRDSAGYYTSPTAELSTATYALTAHVDLGRAAGERGWTVSHPVGTVRIAAKSTSESPLFVGIGPKADVDRWLSGVAHEEVTTANFASHHPSTKIVNGSNAPADPSRQTFWVAKAAGTKAATAVWKSASGDWTVVVSNADARQGVTADVTAGAKTGVLLPIGIGLLVVAALTLFGAGLVTYLALRQLATHERLVATRTAPPGSFPLRLTGRLDEPLSRWLWLVKWVLVIPHLIVLSLLWLAVTVTTIIAGVAILFTGRYPRSIFEFNVGVMRWSWRVGFYTTSAFGTDRYPPFSLASDPGYPADLRVDYPDRLSRGLVLVKWWLLAIPQLIIVGILTGGFGVSFGFGLGKSWTFVGGGGIITLLALIAAIVLLAKGRYPESLFDVVIGLNRWTFRVLAYVALMTDVYPPFRFDGGGVDPGSVMPPPAPPPVPPAATAPAGAATTPAEAVTGAGSSLAGGPPRR